MSAHALCFTVPSLDLKEQISNEDHCNTSVEALRHRRIDSYYTSNSNVDVLYNKWIYGLASKITSLGARSLDL